MAREQSIRLRETLKRLFPDSTLRALARESGFVQRQRKVDPVAFFWTLVLGFACGPERSVSAMRRAYQRATSTTIVPSAFYDRFSRSLVRFLRRTIDVSIDSFQVGWTKLDNRLDQFRDLVLVDATVFKLHDALRKVFAGCRENSAPAAAKLHLVVSVTGKGDSTIGISPERVGDLRKLRVGPWVRGRLLLFDLGYFRYQLFSCIERNKGFFLTRLKEKTNPLITKNHHAECGGAIQLEGRKLQDVLGRLRRDELDVEIEATFEKRRYRGRVRTDRLRLRLVAVRDKVTKTYHAYVTNVPAEVLTARELAGLYRARWEIELLFKELKSGYRLSQISSQKREVVEAMIYSTVLTLIASRALLRGLAERVTLGSYRATAGRWWKLLAMYAQDLLLLLMRPPRDAPMFRGLFSTFLHEIVDPHTRRRPLLAQWSC